MKNRFIFFLSIILLFIIFMTNVSCASSGELVYTYDGVNYTVPELPEEVYQYKYYFISHENSNYRVYYSNQPFVYLEKCLGFTTYGVDCLTCNRTVSYYQYNNSLKKWENVSNRTGLHVSGFLKPTKNYWYSMVYTNADICDSSGKVFFQRAPLVGVVVPAVEKVEQIPATIMKTMKIIIPVSLIVLSVVLLISLTKLAFSRMV